MTNHRFKKISDAIEGRESRLFRETPAGFALTYTEMITLSGRYAEALAGLGLKPGESVGALGLRRMLGLGSYQTAWLSASDGPARPGSPRPRRARADWEICVGG
ncbi:MAG: hypothetical protein CR217_06685 [Beijerinckiaceae bacterium]|nr:MAG: hypothetical protein CR217_06685 [Beijerinckiaceae bacterium]